MEIMFNEWQQEEINTNFWAFVNRVYAMKSKLVMSCQREENIIHSTS